MASLTQWTWVWVNSGSWWWTGRPGVLQFMGLQSWTWPSEWTEVNPCSSAIAPSPPRHVTSNSSENKNESLDRGTAATPGSNLFKQVHTPRGTLSYAQSRALSVSLVPCRAGDQNLLWKTRPAPKPNTPKQTSMKRYWLMLEFYREIIQPDYATVNSRIQ